MPADERAVQRSGLRLLAELPRLAEAFQRRVRELHAAPGLEDQTEPTNATVQYWLRGLFVGPWNEDHLHEVEGLGRTFLDVGLPEAALLGGLSTLRLAIAEMGHTDLTSRQ